MDLVHSSLKAMHVEEIVSIFYKITMNIRIIYKYIMYLDISRIFDKVFYIFVLL